MDRDFTVDYSVFIAEWSAQPFQRRWCIKPRGQCPFTEHLPKITFVATGQQRADVSCRRPIDDHQEDLTLSSVLRTHSGCETRPGAAARPIASKPSQRRWRTLTTDDSLGTRGSARISKPRHAAFEPRQLHQSPPLGGSKVGGVPCERSIIIIIIITTTASHEMSYPPDGAKTERVTRGEDELPAKPIRGKLAIWVPRIATFGYLGLNIWRAQQVPGPHGVAGLAFYFFGTSRSDRHAARETTLMLASPLLIWTVEGYRAANSMTPLAW